MPLYTLRGPVVHGRHKGTAVGMPTANLTPPPDRPLPPFGVYAARVRVGDAAYIGVTNVGCRPTVDDVPVPTVETYILDFSGNLYGKEITVELIAFLRPIRKMASLADVKSQVDADGRRARALLADCAE